MAKFLPPKEFDFVPEKWLEWSSRWERYRVISKTDEEEEEFQVNCLLYTMGSDSESIMNSFTLSADDRKKYDEVKKAFDKYFSPRKYVIFERARFFRRDQMPGETVEQYVRALNDIAGRCEFGDKRSEQMRDRIVVGILDTAVSREMQKMDVAALTEDVAINMARQAEQVDKNMKELSVNRSAAADLLASTSSSGTNNNNDSKTAVTDAVNARGRYNKPGGSKAKSHSTTSNNDSSSKCKRCGYKTHTQGKCPAADVSCNKCSKTGHYARCCLSKPKSVNDVDADEPSDDQLFLGAVEVGQSGKSWTKHVQVSGVKIPVRFKLDSGADVTIIPNQLCGNIVLTPSDRTLLGAGNSSIDVIGYFDAKLSVAGKNANERMYVVKQSKALLSRDACVRLGLIKLLCDVDQLDVTNGLKFKDEFKSLFTGLGRMHREVEIELRSDNRSAYSIHTPRSVPYPMLNRVRAELNDMVNKGVIFEVDQPTEWVAPMVVVPKPNNAVRICVDYTELNKVVRREVYPMSHVEASLAKLGRGTIFTKLDANSGFYQIPLSNKSKLLTTFLTPFGRFAFNRLPFGLSSSPEIYSKIVSEVLSGLDGVIVHMDDVCVFGESIDEHDSRVREVLRRMSKAGMTLNSSKCEFSKSAIKFLGHVISASGIKANPDSIQGIRDFSRPQNVTEVRSFLGMANQLSKFTTLLGELSGPLRELLCKNVDWYWGHSQEQSFQDIKAELSRSVELAAYNPTYQTIVQTDASRNGLGAALLQLQPNGSMRLVCAASRSLTETEKRYATIEQEALGVVWACEKFRDYIIGLTVVIQTDHKPLVPLLNDIELDKLPIRVQRFRMRLLRFSYRVEHIAGKSNIVADALSRSNNMPSSSDVSYVGEVELYAVEALKSCASTGRLSQLKELQRSDEVISRVLLYVKTSWPDYLSSDQTILRPYFENRSKLSLIDDLLVYEDRIVIPMASRLETLTQIHKGHLGITKCRERARQCVWWPGMSQHIAEMVRNCQTCRRHSNVVKEPLMRSEFPSRPWERVGSDLFHFESQWYLLLVDYHSRFVEIAPLSHLNSVCVIENMKSVFARHGIPEMLISDNGPQYASEEFKKFVQSYAFIHTTSSPKHSPANGAAERAVQTVKMMLKKEKDPYLALLAYRSTPLENGYSPSELLMNRKLRTTIPSLPLILQSKLPDEAELQNREQSKREASKINFDSRHRSVELRPLSPGENVIVRDMQREAEVVQPVNGTPRSYIVKDRQGSQIRRNRLNLVPMDSSSCETPQSESTSSDRTPDTKLVKSRVGRIIKPPQRLDL